MLEMRPDCERCGVDLPADEPGGHICSFECSFCDECRHALDGICPNCGGTLSPRPTRSRELLEGFPASVIRSFKK